MDYVKKYASEEALRQSEQEAVSSSSESSMSDFSEDEAQVSCSLFVKDVNVRSICKGLYR